MVTIVRSLKFAVNLFKKKTLNMKIRRFNKVLNPFIVLDMVLPFFFSSVDFVSFLYTVTFIWCCIFIRLWCKSSWKTTIFHPSPIQAHLASNIARNMCVYGCNTQQQVDRFAEQVIWVLLCGCVCVYVCECIANRFPLATVKIFIFILHDDTLRQLQR